MSDNVAITAGSGTNIAADDVSSVFFQKVKLDVGGDGASVPLVGTAGGAPKVNLVSGSTVEVGTAASPLYVSPATSPNAQPVTDNAGSLTVDDGGSSVTVDAPVGSPAFVRLSDGTDPITTLPVSGSVTAAQGTAAANSGAWPTKISDGTDSAGLSTVGGSKALKVDVIQAADPAGVLADKATFTEGTTKESVAAGVYNPTRVGDVGDNQAGALRITAKGDLQVSLTDSGGTERGTAAAPLFISPATSPLDQPITGTITAKIKDESGADFTALNPVPVEITPSGRTRVTSEATLTASQTGQSVWAPASGKKFVITSVQLAITVAGTLTLYDHTDSAANHVFAGTQATGNREYGFGSLPWQSATANNILRWTSGTGLAGVMTVHGYEL